MGKVRVLEMGVRMESRLVVAAMSVLELVVELDDCCRRGLVVLLGRSHSMGLAVLLGYCHSKGLAVLLVHSHSRVSAVESDD